MTGAAPEDVRIEFDDGRRVEPHRLSYNGVDGDGLATWLAIFPVGLFNDVIAGGGHLKIGKLPPRTSVAWQFGGVQRDG